MMKHVLFAAAVSAGFAATAGAVPILTTTGTWQEAPVASNLGDAPWNHRSYDCTTCNAGYVLGIGSGWYYLDAPWTLTEVEWTEIYSLTAYQNRKIWQTADGVVHYRNLDTLDEYSSNGAGWEQFTLLVQIITARTSRWTFLLEDIPLLAMGTRTSDNDRNDGVLQAEYTIPSFERPDRPTDPVPEPASLALFGMGMLMVASRWRSRAIAVHER